MLPRNKRICQNQNWQVRPQRYRPWKSWPVNHYQKSLIILEVVFYHFLDWFTVGYLLTELVNLIWTSKSHWECIGHFLVVRYPIFWIYRLINLTKMSPLFPFFSAVFSVTVNIYSIFLSICMSCQLTVAKTGQMH